MSRIVPFRPSSSRSPLRNTSGPALGLTVGLVALAVMAQKLGGDDEVKNLRELANVAPALYLREEAVLGLAEHGDETVVPDLVAMLDERNLHEMRVAADEALERLVGRSFGANEAAAHGWLLSSGRPTSPVTGVAGRDVGPWPDGLASSDGSAAFATTVGDELRVHVRAPLSAQFNLVFTHDQGSFVLECSKSGNAYTIRSRDVPNSFRALDCFAPFEVAPTPAGLEFALPRLGRLADAKPPASLHVIRESY